MRRLTLFFLIALSTSGIVSPQAGELELKWNRVYNTVKDTVDVVGAANIPNQFYFFLEAAPWDPAEEEPTWKPVTSFQMSPVLDDLLGTWNTSRFTDGFYQLRLHAVNSANESFHYVLAPILVNNNDGDLVNLEPVEVIARPGMEMEPDNGMAPSPAVDDRLPLPVGGHVAHFSEAAQEAMHSAGMTWVKWQIPFHIGIDDFVARDRINRTHNAGMLVLLSVTGHKHDLAEGGDEYLDAYAEFLGEVAALGADAIEVWNEMNLDREWPTGQIDPRRYAVMLQKAYTAIKAANPDTMVITGALAPTGAEGAFGLSKVWNDDRYYRGMANAGVANYADCIGAHYNEGVLPPTAQGGDPRANDYPTRYFLPMLNRVAWPFSNTDIPMCLTEMGYLTREGYGPLPQSFEWARRVTVAQQADWLAQAILMASNYTRMPVELVIIWNIDFDYYGADPQAGYAIIRPDGSCPACDTIAELQR
jgi:hypothetical protein